MLEGLRVVGYTEELILSPLKDVVADVLEGIQHIIHGLFALHDFTCAENNGGHTSESKNAHSQVKDVVTSVNLEEWNKRVQWVV